LPPRLEILHVRNCNKLLSKHANWQLEGLFFPEELAMERLDDAVIFPENHPLPLSLTFFSLHSFPSLGLIH